HGEASAGFHLGLGTPRRHPVPVIYSLCAFRPIGRSVVRRSLLPRIAGGEACVGQRSLIEGDGVTVHRYSRAVNPPQVTPRRDAAPAVTLSAQTYRRLSSRSDSQPRVWLWGAGADLLVVGGSAVVALLAVLWARYSGVAQSGVFPEWAFIVFILMIDVAHVYATLFRTYLDGSELRRHPARYYGVPIVLFAVLGSTHWLSSAWF